MRSNYTAITYKPLENPTLEHSQPTHIKPDTAQNTQQQVPSEYKSVQTTIYSHQPPLKANNQNAATTNQLA